ncbi:tRNA (adenosine(37)-N6)-dimethylallyltransferase MiaA [Mumia zhuanghuii]|uniref:tRNA dimethylallyltransferase n=1 Tax=Mumia zhuanghuii TaxID=2585211 RepID=A0A5Q6RRH5_9ACTN|nr:MULTISPECIES: tRNA (adenosine(37)-N6)-dimethylallyltransferase MiaA [Mumia]KAA1420656.1 tRNA (adenosine(37)-N6)-dimethylallyltransferase MiaA [Mumia zhuanghuii]
MDAVNQPVVAVVGPTAAGKSDLAVALAQRIGGEIVNVDAYQIYRGMDVGTAKLPEDERGGVPHHLLDVLDVSDSATVAEFQGWARAAIDDIRGRDAVPVLVGGSALYVRAVVDAFEFPGTDPEVRSRLEEELRTLGPEALHRRLAEQDPQAAASILVSNGRRIVRALEVVEITGRPFAASLPAHTAFYDDVRMIGVDVPRDVLDDRITRRVDRMWEAGLVDEVRALGSGLATSRTASRALGYSQVLAFLAGTMSEDEAKDATVRGTRKFARRQDSWFRKDPRIVWLPYDAPDLVEQAVEVSLTRGCGAGG